MRPHGSELNVMGLASWVFFYGDGLYVNYSCWLLCCAYYVLYGGRIYPNTKCLPINILRTCVSRGAYYAAHAASV